MPALDTPHPVRTGGTPHCRVCVRIAEYLDLNDEGNRRIVR